MSNTVSSPNMGMPVPVVGTDPGPDWSTNLNASLSIVDSHNHSTGQGVQVTPAGINVNTDLTMGGNNLISTRSVRFASQGAPIANAADLDCIYVSGVDLYYNDGNGNQVRITNSGSVTGSSGTITGLPSGTASAAYSAGTFTFQGATSTPATMAVGPLVIGAAVASAKTVTIAPSSGLAANYAWTLPSGLPGSTSLISVDSSGNMANVGTTGSGSAVLATAPVFAGVPTGTITAASFSPTVTFTHAFGPTATLSITSNRWYYQRIGNVVSVSAEVQITVTDFPVGPDQALYSWSADIPIATAALNPGGPFVTSSGSAGSVGSSGVSSVAGSNSFVINNNGAINLGCNYMYLVS